MKYSTRRGYLTVHYRDSEDDDVNWLPIHVEDRLTPDELRLLGKLCENWLHEGQNPKRVRMEICGETDPARFVFLSHKMKAVWNDDPDAYFGNREFDFVFWFREVIEEFVEETLAHRQFETDQYYILADCGRGQHTVAMVDDLEPAEFDLLCCLLRRVFHELFAEFDWTSEHAADVEPVKLIEARLEWDWATDNQDSHKRLLEADNIDWAAFEGTVIQRVEEIRRLRGRVKLTSDDDAEDEDATTETTSTDVPNTQEPVASNPRTPAQVKLSDAESKIVDVVQSNVGTTYQVVNREMQIVGPNARQQALVPTNRAQSSKAASGTSQPLDESSLWRLDVVNAKDVDSGLMVEVDVREAEIHGPKVKKPFGKLRAWTGETKPFAQAEILYRLQTGEWLLVCWVNNSIYERDDSEFGIELSTADSCELSRLTPEVAAIWLSNELGYSTEQLVAAFSSFARPSPSVAPRTDPPKPTSPLIVWDRALGELSLNGAVVCKVRSVKRAKCIVPILEAFQSAEWARVVAPKFRGAQQRSEAIRYLKRRVKGTGLIFEADGNDGIRWVFEAASVTPLHFPSTS